jgi:imidazolonepropionase-like amidohydrolase
VQYATLFAPAERAAFAQSWHAAAGTARRVELRERQRLIGRLAAAGGKLALAGGAPEVPYGLGLHAGLRLLERAGLGRADVLRSATTEAAAALGLANELGSVAPGLQADLLIVAGDPLADLDDLLALETVIVAGRVRWVAPPAPE